MSSLLLFRFENVFFASPNQYFQYGGDSFKNHATCVYHVNYDKDLLHYDGMNYPYGDHVVFSDNQPIISNILKVLKPVFPSIGNSVVPIINRLIIVNLLLAAIIVFLIFRKYKLSTWLAVLASMLIVFLSPQLERMTAHYGLAYVMIIPLFLYLMLQFERRKSFWQYLSMFFILFLSAQIHMYFFGILGMTLLVYAMVRLLYAEEMKMEAITSFKIILVAIFSYIALKLWTNYGVDVMNRPEHPYGFFEYRSYWESILLNDDNPLLKWVNKNVVKFRNVPWEGKSFIGLGSGLFAIVIGLKWLLSKGKRKVVSYVSSHRMFSRTILTTSLLILLFSMGLPFVIPGLEGLVDHFGPIGQLRSIGRFSWVFYYVITIFSVIYIDGLVKKKPSIINYILLGSFLVLFSIDAYQNMIKRDYKLYDISFLDPSFKDSENYWFKDINIDDYQAILPIPYVHLGSEHIGIHGPGWSFSHSTMASLMTGIPSMGVNMSRISLDQTLKSIELTHGSQFKLPAILNDFKNIKPLLIVYDKTAEKEDPTLNKYNHLVNRGQLLFEDEKVRLYQLQLNTFDNIIEDGKSVFLEELDSLVLYEQGPFQSTVDSIDFYYNDFNDNTSDVSYHSMGAYNAAADPSNLFDIIIPNQKIQSYEISFWTYVGTDLSHMLKYELIEYLPGTDHIYGRKKAGVTWSTEIIDGKWSFEKMIYTPVRTDTQLKLVVQNDHKLVKTIIIDEVLVKPSLTHLYRVDEKMLWKNNLHYLK